MTIPAGVESGVALRLNGKGSDGAGNGRTGDLYVVITVKDEEELPLVHALGRDRRDRRLRDALGLRVDEEQRQAERLRQLLRVDLLAGRRAGDDEHVVRDLDAGDEDLLAVHHVAVALALGDGLHAEAVAAGVGLRDREDEDRLAGDDAGDDRRASAPRCRS